MDFGISIRSFRGTFRAITVAGEIDCQAVQFTATNPNSFEHGEIDERVLTDLGKHIKKMIPGKSIIHAPYEINLVTTDEVISGKTKKSLIDALARAKYIGVDYVISHIGNHRGIGYEAGIKQAHKMIKEILDASDSPAMIVLEMGPGGRTNIGSKFEEIAEIFEGVPDYIERVGLCIDTAHLWATGYKIDSKQGVEDMFSELKKYVGIEKLKVIHLNDTVMGLGFNHDRHFDIGMGKIGKEGFKTIVNYRDLDEHIPGIIETPPGDSQNDDIRNLDVLIDLVDK